MDVSSAIMNGAFWLIWFATAAGWAKLLAIAENVIHGIGLPLPTLKRIRSVHNVLLVVVPPVLAVTLGLTGPGWAWSGDLHWLSSVEMLWFLPGAIGLVLLILSTLRYGRYRPPACETVISQQMVDLSAGAGRDAFIGLVRGARLARLPLNEQFHLEVSTKSYVLPRLPAAWDGLSVVHFSDLHFRGPVTRRFFEAVADQAAALNGDVLAFTGDLLDHRQCLEWIEPVFGRLSAPLGCYFVLGNHDWYLPETNEVRQRLTALGWQDLSSRVIELRRDDAVLAVGGSERPWMGTDPDFSIASPRAFRVLLSHSPDQFNWARRRGVDLMFAGHTHGGQIRLPMLGPVYSPSRYSCRYASGTFWQPPTLLYVTRGISGREPIRYRCPPELTKLVLRCAPMDASQPVSEKVMPLNS